MVSITKNIKYMWVKGNTGYNMKITSSLNTQHIWPLNKWVRNADPLYSRKSACNLAVDPLNPWFDVLRFNQLRIVWYCSIYNWKTHPHTWTHALKSVLFNGQLVPKKERKELGLGDVYIMNGFRISLGWHEIYPVAKLFHWQPRVMLRGL